MPRFTEDIMKQAVLRVTEEGVSINRVAKEGGLCKKTLKSYVDKYLSNIGDCGTEVRFRPNYEINQVFTNDHESIFEEHLIALDRAQRKITRDFVRKEAFNFAISCNVHVPKTWNIRRQAGLDWMYGYLSRHPKIKAMIVRNKKENRSLSCHSADRLTVDENGIVSIEDIKIEKNYCSSDEEFEATEIFGDNESVEKPESNLVDEYYHSLLKSETDNSLACKKNYLSRINVKSPLDEFVDTITMTYGLIAEDGFVDAERVYNLGEIALEVDNPYTRKFLVTACCFMNASGDCLPPFFVFPKMKKVNFSSLKNIAEGVDATIQSDGRLDDDCFMLVLKHFRKLVNVTPSNKVALIMDADEYHITINSIDFCEQHGIELVTLPPHYGSIIQPAASHIFPIIRFLFNQYVDRFRAAHPLSQFTLQQTALLFCRIQPIAFTNENVCKAFSENGIFPLNEDIFQKKQLLATKAEQRETLPLSVDLPSETCLDFLDIHDREDSRTDEMDTDYLSSSNTGLAELNSMPSNFKTSNLVSKTLFQGTPIAEFFNNLVHAYDELKAEGNANSEAVYNLDELEIFISTLQFDHSRPRISICCYANALGRSLPPFVVYPENNYSTDMLAGGVPGMRGMASSNGCINNAIFLQMLEHFQQCVGATQSNRVILILDCQDYHISLQTIDFCKANGIILVTVPPHVSEPLQPLEKIAFRTFLSDFQSKCVEYMKTERVTEISMFDIASLLNKTFEYSFTPENIVSGFRLTGVWPLNEDLFPRDELNSKYWETRREYDTKMESDNDTTFVKVNDDDNDRSSETSADSDSTFSSSDRDVIQFYNRIEDFLGTQDDGDGTKSPEERIFVLGEVYLKTSRVSINVMLFVNAIGSLLPPYLIYSTDMNDILMENSLGITGYRIENKDEDADTLLKSICYFQEHLLASNDQKTMLLINDPEGSRLKRNIREFGDSYDIIFATFPATCDSDHLHPLENSFLKVLKQRFEAIQADTSSQLISINDVVSFLEITFFELFVVDEIVDAFKECGISSMRSVHELFLAGEESYDERQVVGQRVEVDLGAVTGDTHRINGSSKDYEDFIIEEEIEVAVDEAEFFSVDQKGSKITFLCANCEMEFETQQDLQAHEKQSSCRYCDVVCCDRVVRDVHELDHMDGTLHCCPDCDKQCASRTALMQHRRKHKR